MSKIALVFPGQGAQYVGMGKDFFEQFATAKKMYEQANLVLGFDLAKICFEGPEVELKQTRVTQPAIFVHSCVIMEVLRERFGDNVNYAMTAGHSLGEYSALVASGMLTFEDALNIVKIRALAMQKAGEMNKGTMAAIIGMEAELLDAVCKEASASGIVQCANYNSPGQIVISGTVDGVKAAMELAKTKGARMVKELVVSGAFHSPLMVSAQIEVEKCLTTIHVKDTNIPVYANVSAKAVTSGAEEKKMLVDQITGAVVWDLSVTQMIAAGATKFFEIGPGNVLQGLIKRIDKNVTCECIGKTEQLDIFS